MERRRASCYMKAHRMLPIGPEVCIQQNRQHSCADEALEAVPQAAAGVINIACEYHCAQRLRRCGQVAPVHIKERRTALPQVRLHALPYDAEHGRLFFRCT